MVCYGIFWSGQFCIAVVFHFSWEYADLPGESKTLRSNPVNADTEGAIESVRMSGVSVKRGFTLVYSKFWRQNECRMGDSIDLILQVTHTAKVSTI